MVPSWYVSPRFQIKAASQLWPGQVMPPVPEFTRRTPTELLLLVPSGTFEELWKFTPREFLCATQPGDKFTSLVTFDDPTWVAVDTEADRGMPPRRGDESRLTLEAFTAAVSLWPHWPYAWGDNHAAAPYITGSIGMPRVGAGKWGFYAHNDGMSVLRCLYGDYRLGPKWANPTMRVV